MAQVSYPALYQINTRVWLTGLSRALGKQSGFGKGASEVGEAKR